MTTSQRPCSKCGQPALGKYSQFCDPCRATVRRKPGKYVWTRDKDQVLRDRYDGTVKGRPAEIAAEFGWPAWAIKKRAALLGLTQPVDRKNWTAEETDFLRQHVGRRTVNWIGKQLGRSITSVVLKAKRMKISRAFLDGYTLRRLEACFGCDHRIIQEWIRDGKLKAIRRATDRPLDAWYTTDAEVLRFILRCPTAFRLDKVDQPWFMGLIMRAAERPAAAPVQMPKASPKQVVEIPPKGTFCALCARKIEGPAIPERRPSGPRGEMQTWWYCRSCKAA